jgi:hypothetical protein
MSGYLWLPQQAGVPEPGEIVAYLQQQGWRLEKPSAEWAEYAKDLKGEHVILEVPLKAAARDYPRVFGILLDDLSRLESRAPSAVLRDIKTVGVDIVRLAIDSSLTKDGRIPVEAGRLVYRAARDLLLSAACSAIDPRPVFPKRKPDEAMRLLDRARFGQTEVGSFVLTMECTIAPKLQQPLPAEDDDLGGPFERRACIKLAQALQGAEAATQESRESRKLDPFTTRTDAGVSANLCDAVAEVIEATSADALSASFSFAARRPLAVRVPRQVVFSADAAPILREAAARLRDEATYPETTIVGPIVKLDSDDPDQGGVAVVRALIDGRYRSVWVTLTPKRYEQAMDAHKAGQRVRCTGDIAREGRSWVLRKARNFGLLAPGGRMR